MSSEAIDLFKHIATLLTPVASAFGGYYLRDKASEKDFIRDQFSNVCSEIEKVQEISSKYWSRKVDAHERTDVDISQEEEIISKNYSINLSIINLSVNISAKNYAEIQNLVMELRQASSLGDASTTSQTRLPNITAIKTTYSKGQDLISKLTYCSRYPVGIWRKKT